MGIKAVILLCCVLQASAQSDWMPDFSTWWSSPDDGITLPASPAELQAASLDSATVAPPQLHITDDYEPEDTTDATMDYDFEDEYDAITTGFPDYEETTTESSVPSDESSTEPARPDSTTEADSFHTTTPFSDTTPTGGPTTTSPMDTTQEATTTESPEETSTTTPASRSSDWTSPAATSTQQYSTETAPTTEYATTAQPSDGGSTDKEGLTHYLPVIGGVAGGLLLLAILALLFFCWRSRRTKRHIVNHGNDSMPEVKVVTMS